MNKKKGFTLIELIGVIVLLTIIALIAIPTIMNLVNDGIKKSFVSSAYGIIKAGDLYYSRKDMMGESLEETMFEFPNNTKDLEYDGSTPKSGNMIIDEEGNIALAISNGKYCLRKGYHESEVVFDIDINDCYVYEDEYEYQTENGKEYVHQIFPEVKIGMIPIMISIDGIAKKAHSTSNWHNYSEKMWANAVTVTDESREKYMNADVGTEIAEEDILTYFVWIPRYKYKLWYVDNKATTSVGPHSIDIVFESIETKKSTGSANGEYLTHPAFTFGEEELNGIWVGKFEAGYSGTTAPGNVIDSTKLIIKPSTNNNKINIWRNINISNAFYTVRGMNEENNIFGLTNDSDAHVAKRTEWGAMAYLSHSEYGTCTDGVCTEIYINNTNGMITGCGGDSASEYPSTKLCKNQYGTKEDGIYNQSTTVNISGIFDTSGGTNEMLMAYTTGASTEYGSSGFDSNTFPDKKYIDIYNSTSFTAYYNRILGDATGELGPLPINGNRSSWYEDYAGFINSSNPWSKASGFWGDGTSTGIFNFGATSGGAGNYVSFRVVLV